ncbi:MAG: hypothetical protein FJ098_10705 [Deltaproteobacteria bacterium]|nr:hypothetical protein [Deltaproteobacteria bacterium]
MEATRRRAAGPRTVIMALLAAGLDLMPGHLKADEPAVLAVFPLEDKTGKLADAVEEKLTDYLGTRMGEGGLYQVIPSADVRQRIAQAREETHKACYDTSCQVELGRQLAAGKTLAARVMTIGKVCAVSLQLYDLGRAATDKTASIPCRCDEESLFDALDRGVVRLGGVPPAGGFRAKAVLLEQGRGAKTDPAAFSTPEAEKELQFARYFLEDKDAGEAIRHAHIAMDLAPGWEPPLVFLQDAYRTAADLDGEREIIEKILSFTSPGEKEALALRERHVRIEYEIMKRDTERQEQAVREATELEVLRGRVAALEPVVQRATALCPLIVRNKGSKVFVEWALTFWRDAAGNLQAQPHHWDKDNFGWYVEPGNTLDLGMGSLAVLLIEQPEGGRLSTYYFVRDKGPECPELELTTTW